MTEHNILYKIQIPEDKIDDIPKESSVRWWLRIHLCYLFSDINLHHPSQVSNLQHFFPKKKGVEGRLELFRKLIRFCEVRLPNVKIKKVADVNSSWRRKKANMCLKFHLTENKVDFEMRSHLTEKAQHTGFTIQAKSVLNHQHQLPWKMQ